MTKKYWRWSNRRQKFFSSVWIYENKTDCYRL